MSDYISKSAIKYTYTDVRGDDGHMWTIPCVGKDEIDDLPTIDAVPVVRCKECKWWDTDGYKDGYGECPNVFCETTADWFCADGERREDESD